MIMKRKYFSVTTGGHSTRREREQGGHEREIIIEHKQGLRNASPNFELHLEWCSRSICEDSTALTENVECFTGLVPFFVCSNFLHKFVSFISAIISFLNFSWYSVISCSSVLFHVNSFWSALLHVFVKSPHFFVVVFFPFSRQRCLSRFYETNIQCLRYLVWKNIRSTPPF